MYQKINVEELNQRLKAQTRLQLVDVRSAGEYATGHIPGTLNVPMEQIEARISDLILDGPVILICQGGQRACICAELIASKHKNVSVLEGGTSAWVADGHPVVVNSVSRWSLERQVRLAAGLLVVLGVSLSLVVDSKWIYLAGFVGLGLTFAGATDVCMMARLLAIMPWNKPPKSKSKTMPQSPQCAL
jgi:rhodanese-related sulfurtransferase